MTKKEAIQRYGIDVVELAREFYETDFGKVLFEEDIKAEEDSALETSSVVEVLSYLIRAKLNIERAEISLKSL